MSSSRTLSLVLTAAMTAILCLLAPISIPLPGLVPISLATFAIYQGCFLQNWKGSAASVAAYLLLGAAGLPVFSSYQSGPGILLGPTGGYLIGYLPLAAICGLIYSMTENRILLIGGSILATALLYVIGTAWLMVSADLSLVPALMAGMVPFIPGDLVKILVAVLIGPEIKKRLAPLSQHIERSRHLIR